MTEKQQKNLFFQIQIADLRVCGWSSLLRLKRAPNLLRRFDIKEGGIQIKDNYFHLVLCDFFAGMLATCSHHNCGSAATSIFA